MSKINKINVGGVDYDVGGSGGTTSGDEATFKQVLIKDTDLYGNEIYSSIGPSDLNFYDNENRYFLHYLGEDGLEITSGHMTICLNGSEISFTDANSNQAFIRFDGDEMHFGDNDIDIFPGDYVDINSNVYLYGAIYGPDENELITFPNVGTVKFHKHIKLEEETSSYRVSTFIMQNGIESWKDGFLWANMQAECFIVGNDNAEKSTQYKNGAIQYDYQGNEYEIALPEKSGTLATLDDITSGGGSFNGGDITNDLNVKNGKSLNVYDPFGNNVASINSGWGIEISDNYSLYIGEPNGTKTIRLDTYGLTNSSNNGFKFKNDGSISVSSGQGELLFPEKNGTLATTLDIDTAIGDINSILDILNGEVV